MKILDPRINAEGEREIFRTFSIMRDALDPTLGAC